MTNVSIILATICVLVIIAATSPAALGVDLSPGAVEKWFENLPNAKENMTKLHFYHQTGTDAVTVGPEPNSTMLGRAQLTYSPLTFNKVGLLMALNFVFTQGEYNGSILSVLGPDPAWSDYDEVAIIGGSGVFRLARGVVIAKVYSFNDTTHDSIVEYNGVVLHY